MKMKIKRHLCYIACAGILMLIAYGMLSKPDLQIRIIYALGQQIETEEYLLFDFGRGYAEQEKIVGRISLEETASRRMFDVFFDIPDRKSISVGMPSGIQFQLQPRIGAKDSRIQIRKIEILNHHLSMKAYAPKDIQELFTYQNVDDLSIEGDSLCITTQGEQYAILEAKDSFVQDYAESTGVSEALIWNLLFVWILLSGAAILIDWAYIKSLYQSTNIKDKERRGKIQIAMGTIMVIALGCVVIMALMSKYYAHPDEDVTRMATDYYMTHWLPPNVQDVSVLGTFSNYGATRLTEPTLYYLIAGKVGWIFATFFHISKYFRILNVLLFSIMVFMLLRKRKTLWMMLAIGITPQIWYLFSYATSDAWDFFWAFMAVYELLEPDSALHKFLSNRSYHPAWNVLGVSVIFSMLFRGKRNYYLILLFAFIVLIIRWWRLNKEVKAKAAMKYVIIAGCSLFLLLPRIGIEYYLNHQPGENTAAVESYTPTPTTVVETRQEQGYSFLEVAIYDAKDIISGLTNSGVGSYGWLEYHNSYWYGFAITGLYGIVALFIMYYMIRNRKLAGVLDAGILSGMILLTYLMVVYTCWSSDFQAQGRYVLPITLIVGYYSMQEKEIAYDKKLGGLLLALGVISLISYIGKGLVNLI